MKHLFQTLTPIIELTCFKEYLASLTVTTILGANVAGKIINSKLTIVLLANSLAAGFIFVINDVENAATNALVLQYAIPATGSAPRPLLSIF